jgi:hypothetical protein
MTEGCEDYDDEGDKIDESSAIPNASWRRRAATYLERFDLGTSNMDG